MKNRIARGFGVTLIILLGLILSVSAKDSQQAIKWTNSAPLPEPRAGYAAGAINGKLVIVGGTYWEGVKGKWTKKQFTSSTHAFDPSKQSWEKLPDAPVPLGYGASTVVGGKLFVLGGYNGSAVNRKIFTLEYVKGKYSWRTFGDMPGDRVFAEAVNVKNSIYLLGGLTQFEPVDSAGSCCTSSTATNSLLVFDTKKPKEGWKELPPYPGPKRWGFSVATDGESIWMFGGTFQANVSDPTTHFNEVLRYKIAQSSWEVSKPLPDSLAGSAGATLFLKDDILLIGGKQVWLLHLSNLKYSEMTPLPQVAFVTHFVWLKNEIIGAGGENTIEGPRKRSEWTFIGRFVKK